MRRRTVIRMFTLILIILFALFCTSVAFNTLKSKKTNDKYINITTLDEYYSNSLTSNYKDIRKLPNNYTIENLKEDKGYIVLSNETYNKNIYTEFMNKYKQKRKTFIRVGTNIDGNLIIYDILYDSNKELLLIEDYSRDPNKAKKDFTIKRFKYTKELQINNKTYWILYNEEKDNLLDDKDTFIISEIKE